MLSISDDSHHVTETIGHLYGENYDRDVRRLSFLPTPQGETLSVSIPNNGTANIHPHQRRTGGGTAVESNTLNPAASKRPTVTKQPSFDKESSSSVHLSPTDSAANSSFPLNDIDYESNPDAIKQEYHTLAAIRRMSMDVAGDPDLPSYNNFQVPTVAPSASADEDDASRLFWVPARLHPELAPKEFRSFLESRKEQIQRRSGDYSSSLGVEREESKGGLRRKRSKLSKQIDDSQEYVDGADFLGGKKANAHDGKGESSSPNLRELEGIVNDQKQVNPETLALLGSIEKLDLSTTDDKPILPAAPPGHSLKRSTRTQYRKGSLKRGERPPYSRRLGRTPETLSDSPSGSLENPPPIKPLMRASTDPGRSLAERNAEEVRKPVTSPTTAATASQSSNNTALPAASTTNATFESRLDPQAPNASQRQWQSCHGSNGRSTLQIPPAEQTIPQIIETPPSSSASSSEFDRQLQTGANVERTTQNESQSAPNSIYNKRQPPPRQAAASQTLSDIASHPSLLPGSNTRTDSLSVIPTLVEEKRSDSKKSKDKKDGDGSRKSSWPWSRGSDDKDKKRDSESRKSKKQQASAEKAIDKQDNTRLDVLQTSIDSVPRGRESLILERPIDQRLEEERRKESQRKSSDSKKDKESGLLSSIFGGGKKRSGSDHKKSLSRTLSPEPTYVQLIPDQDYPWTRFTIMEERAIYRMAHIKLANPRRPLHSQVLLSNFMYSYLSKVQKMHPQMVIPTSPAQRAQQQASQQQPQPQQQTDQPDEYTQYQRYQEQYAEQTYDDYNYSSEEQGDHYTSDQHGYENGTDYETSQHGHYDGSYGSLGDAAQLESDEEMW